MLPYSANLSRVVPHGLLVFFPSFPLMDKMLDFWRVSKNSRELLLYNDFNNKIIILLSQDMSVLPYELFYFGSLG